MKDRSYKNYLLSLILAIKRQAKEARLGADHPKEEFESYAQGVLMGYYSVVTLLKHQAFVFCIDQKELGLADIKPDVDLLGLRRNPEVDFGEDNWIVDVMTEEKVKGYLSDLITLLKEQAREVKKRGR